MTRRWLAGLTLMALGTTPADAQKVKMLVPLDSLEARAQRDSNDAPAHYELALGYWLKKSWDLAEKELRLAIAIEPKTAPAYLALSYLPYAQNDKLWEMIDKEKVPPDLLPRVAEMFRLRRQAYLLDPLVDLKPLALMIPPPEAFGLGKTRSAYYTAYMNVMGSFWDGQYAQAYGTIAEAAEGASEDERRTKFSAFFLWLEGLAAAHTFQYDRAIADFQILLDRAAAREHPDSSAFIPFWTANEIRYTLATVLNQGGRTKEAVKLLQEAITVDLGLYMAHVQLAQIYEETHRTNSALEERRRALAANPDDPSLMFDLGEALARAGQIAEAQSVLRQARDANPRNVRALYVLGAVDQLLGNPEEARQCYRQFIATAPSRFADQIAEATRRMEALP